MEIVYKQSFAHFVDNYLATYFSSGVKTFQRTGGGPVLMLVALIINLRARNPETWMFFQIIFWILSIYLFFKGLSLTIKPVIDIFLVWLRKDSILEDNLPLKIELDSENEQIHVSNPEKEPLQLPLSEIRSIQHRSTSSWILTNSDLLIFIPRTGLISGDHDEFMQAVESILDKNEQKY